MSPQETAPFKEWQLLQIEGEEPQPVEETPPEPVKGAKGKAPAKGAAKVEEVVDNRPRTVQLKRDFQEEHGGVGMRFTEGIAKKFATVVLTILICEND